jgi:hypothetical protein
MRNRPWLVIEPNGGRLDVAIDPIAATLAADVDTAAKALRQALDAVPWPDLRADLAERAADDLAALARDADATRGARRPKG